MILNINQGANVNIDELKQQATVRSYEAGKELFHQNDPSNGEFFFVVHGTAGVFRDDFEEGRKPIIEIAAGGTFGELGLLLGKPRNATVKALDELKVVSINEALFRKETESNVKFLAGLMRATIHRIMHLQETVELQGLKIEWELPEDILELIRQNRRKNLQLKEYLNNMRNLSMGPNHLVFAQAAKSDHYIYLILEGEVGIFLDRKAGPELVGKWEAGDFFGYMHLVDEPYRKYTARTLDQNTMLIFLDTDIFYKVMRIYPDYGFSIYRTILTHLLVYQYNLLRARDCQTGIV
ncbi:MAG: cyclic nucleotide-binding domain-containing protein [Leptospiraceae bacterium]|nr:cyclic nucleotide-binding domain-containing protein [Leptospiraceae bacterium]